MGKEIVIAEGKFFGIEEKVKENDYHFTVVTPDGKEIKHIFHKLVQLEGNTGKLVFIEEDE